ncbi:hypothetical protein [Lutibacter sp.]|uniref:hypothetical protein n=1 Tax=Lutibacter sp. TaxID=1925666 RepID=UPI0025C57734|nr:hypothetical protein [Lutibacter sp.]MCF6167976.1 hypothetical protein [Lutibacter sp.]
MRTKISLISLLFILLCLGCATPKFYQEILSTYPKGKKDDFILKSSISPHKIVFKSLKDELKNSSHIIYHFSPNAEWYSKEFSGVIYDVDNNRYYYFENSNKHPRKITVSEEYPYPEDNYYKFVIDNFRNGKIDYLKKLGEISGHSGYRTNEVIYDINLKKNSYNRYTFEDFLFMNGKPTKDIN